MADHTTAASSLAAGDTAPKPPERSAVLAALEAVRDPLSGKGLVAAGLVQGLAIGPGRAGFMIEAPAAEVARYDEVRAAAERALLAVPNVRRAQVVLTAEGGAPGQFEVQPRRAPAPPPGSASARLPPDAQASLHAQKPVARPQPVPFVRKVLAVASGKGGVGKSTVAVNMAVALAQGGLKVGLLDADIYGPSVPRMLGLNAEPAVNADKKLIPLTAFGLKTVSIGFIVDEGSPMIWRGPMASSALTQFITDVVWGEEGEGLDVLVIDMPPGTGDIQLTLAQKVRVDGAVIVSTPQEVALIDVRRGAGMFRKTGVPVLGVVENMAYFEDPSTGEPIPIFGRGGAQGVAAELDAPFLGEVPIDIALRKACDAGHPLVAAEPTAPASQVLAGVAAQVRAALACDPRRGVTELTEHPMSDTQGFIFNHTMLRVKDIGRSLDFYRDVLGFSVVDERHFPEAKFSLFFLILDPEAAAKAPSEPAARRAWLAQLRGVLELTHNHGTEDEPGPVYHDGNSEPRGFGHICVSTPDARAACARFDALGVPYQKRLGQGGMKEIAFIKDPDGYWVEIIQPTRFDA